MTSLTPERRAELRSNWLAPLGDNYTVCLHARELTALLDAADERDRLRAAVRQIADACHWSHDPSGDPEALVAHIGQLQQIAEDACDERDRLLTVADTLGRVNGEYAMEIHRCREALGVDEDTDPHHAAQALAAAVKRVMALAEQWRYKGEFGWGAWQEGHGPDETGQALDYAAGLIRNAIEADDDHSAAIGEHESNREPDLPNGADDE